MAVPLTKLSRWWWGGKEKKQVSNDQSATNTLPDLDFDPKQFENSTLRSMKGAKMVESNRRIKKKWKNREEIRKIDKEYDVVLVQSDGGACLSGSETDDSDWSVGWLEPQASDFQNDGEGDDSFAVLVPCYKLNTNEDEANEEVGPSNRFFNAVRNLPNEHSSESKIPLFMNR